MLFYALVSYGIAFAVISKYKECFHGEKGDQPRMKIGQGSKAAWAHGLLRFYSSSVSDIESTPTAVAHDSIEEVYTNYNDRKSVLHTDDCSDT